MMSSPHPETSVDVIIPVLNEERSIGRVLDDLPRDRLRDLWVVDNGSTDRTVEVALRHGARVTHEAVRGYGRACLSGIDELRGSPPEVVVFLDGDYSDDPRELPALLAPILGDEADLVVGSRVLGRRQRGALLPQARFGNWLTSRLIRLLYGVRMTDLGPFRAIRWTTLVGLQMADPDFGWTAEMQVKAARERVRYREVPVSYRRRIGRSKISGTLSGTIRAGFKILYTVFRHRPGRR